MITYTSVCSCQHLNPDCGVWEGRIYREIDRTVPVALVWYGIHHGPTIDPIQARTDAVYAALTEEPL